METPELDKDQPMTTHRTMTGAKYSQNGHMFSLAGMYTGPDPDYKPGVEEEEVIKLPADDGKAGVLARATAKLSEFAEPEDLTEVNKENSKAAAAERLAV